MNRWAITALCVASTLVLLGPNGASAMDKIHLSEPEPVVFLAKASRILEEYFLEHGKYPATWPQVDITFDCNPHRKTDPDLRPPANSANAWRPKNCKYVYQLTTNAVGNHFRIAAVTPSGRVDYYIESGQEEAIKADASAPESSPK